MVLIFAFWFLNIKNLFHNAVIADNSQSTVEWQRMKADFSETVDKMSQSLDKLEETNKKLKTASSSLVNEFISETNKIASSTASSSLIATSSNLDSNNLSPKLNSNCPIYINCMPATNQSRPCRIPDGCEKITQIVY